MSEPAESWPRRFAVPLAATLGYACAVFVALLAMEALQAERAAREQSRFGNALAEQLAARAEEPLLRQDRVGLGVAANQAAARAEVRQVAIHTMDGRPFVVAGEPPGPDATAFVQPVVVADEATAEVRVALNADAFARPFTHTLVIAWPFFTAGLAITLLAAIGGPRVFAWRRGVTAAPPAPETAAPPAPEPHAPTPGTTLIVANLFADAPSPNDAPDALAAAANLADHIARVYDADVALLPSTGCALLFGDDAGADRPFNAVCATLLLRRLLEHWQMAEVPPTASEHLFRYAVEHFAAPVPAPPELPKSEAASDVLLLSSLVHNGEIVIGQAILDALEGPERIHVDPLENPAAAALATSATPGGILRGVATDYQPLLDAQAREIATAAGFESAQPGNDVE